MPNLTVRASATGLPSATILQFPLPALPALWQSPKIAGRVFLALRVSEQFTHFDDRAMDVAMHEMLECDPLCLERVLRENGEVLLSLRDALAYLTAIDARMQASASRVLTGRAC